MHILILPSWYFSRDSQEITGRMFHHLALGLREKAMDARILYSEYSTSSPLLKKEEYEKEEGVPTWRYRKFYPPKLTKLIITLWKNKCVSDVLDYISKEGEPDLIHAHSYLAASIASAVHQETGVPFIYTERLSAFMTDAVPDHHATLFEEIFTHAARITAVSPGMAECMREFTGRQIEVIPNFFDEALFRIDRVAEKPEKFTWISVGEPAHTKGYDLLLHAFAKLKVKYPNRAMELVLVDEIPQRDILTKLAKSLDIQDDIVWTGLITQETLTERMNRCHAMVSASRVETFGKAMVEAQACGLPVVATKTAGARYILESESQGVLVERKDIDALVSGMEKVMTGYAVYQPCEIADLVKKRFSKSVVMDQWIQLYKSMWA